MRLWPSFSALAGLGSAAAAIGFTWPIWQHPTWWGIHDWPQFYAWYEIPRLTLLRYHELPLWNPYLHGGGPLLGHPLSGFCSPFFVPVLLWGPVIGLKVAAVAFLTLGLWGMWRLMQALGCRPAAAMLPTLLWGFNGWFAMHLAVGHLDVMPLLLLPWVVRALLPQPAVPGQRPGTGNEESTQAGLWWALMLLSGGIYPFLMTGLWLSVSAGAYTLVTRAWRPLKTAWLAMLWMLGFSAIKLLPMLAFAARWVPIPPDQSHLTWPLLHRALFDRQLPLVPLYVEQLGSWEYGAYTGLLPWLVLGGLLALRQPRAVFQSPMGLSLLAAGLVCLLLTFGHAAPWLPYPLLQRLPWLRPFHVSCRWIILALFAASLLTGLASQAWNDGRRRRVMLLWGAALLIAGDLWLVNGRHLSRACAEAPPVIQPREPFRQERIDFVPERLIREEYLTAPYARAMYECLRRGVGVVDAYDPVHLPVSARAVGDAGYRGECYLERASGEVALERWSPNRLQVSVRNEAADRLVVNQHADPGWRIQGAAAPRVASANGLLAVPLRPGTYRLTFSYWPVSVVAGATLTALTAGLAFRRRTVRTAPMIC